MDELTLLRNTRSETEVPPDALHRGRAALLQRAAGGATGAAVRAPRARRSRRWAIGGLTTVGAAAVVTGLVITDLVGLAGWRGGADAAAAAALEQASAAAITAVDPVVGEGQYLRVETDSVHVTSGNVGSTTASYLVTEGGVLYRPADRDDGWVWERKPMTVAGTFGPESEEIADAWWRAVSGDESFEMGDLLRAPAGAFYGGQKYGGFEDLDALPRDPYRLLNHVYRATLGAGPSPDTEALVFIADRLRLGTVPADLRAAMYQAAAMIPGVEFVDGEVNLDGRSGVAIGRVEDAWGTRFEIIIDPATGVFIGEREVVIRADAYGDVPVGTVSEWTAVTTTVVDEAPEGGTVCGKLAGDNCPGD